MTTLTVAIAVTVVAVVAVVAVTTRGVLARRPLVRFVLIGSVLFALFGRGFPDQPGPPTLAPDASDEEVLFREALARDYHRSDAIVRRRLARNLRFARSEPTGRTLSLPARDAVARSDAGLVDESIALGMHETDRVVRRRLVQKVKLGVTTRARAREPGDPELQAYLDAHPERFSRPARIRVSQIFFRDLERAASALDAAKRGQPIAGDALPLPSDLSWLTRAEVATQLGPRFADAIWSLPAGAWQGPITSPYGAHLVRIHERRPAQTASLASVRSAVREALLEERAALALEQRLTELRAWHGSRTEGPS